MSEADDIGCEQALKRLLEFIDRELSDSEHDSVERHLRTCRSCFSEWSSRAGSSSACRRFRRRKLRRKRAIGSAG
jgi:hypothetical protein